MAAIGESLRGLRVRAGLTQKEVARLLSRQLSAIGHQAVSKWERGAALPSVPQFLALCRLYGVRDVLATFSPVPGQAALNAEGQAKLREYESLLLASGLYAPAAGAASVEEAKPERAYAASAPAFDVALPGRPSAPAASNGTAAPAMPPSVQPPATGAPPGPATALDAAPPIQPAAPTVAPTPPRTLPLYDLPASAGTGQLLDDDRCRWVEVDDTVPPGADFGVRLAGDSMQPRFANGQVVWVRRQPALEHGQIGLFFYDGAAYCKRFEAQAGRLRLASLNPAYAPIHVTNTEDLRVFGRVLG